MSPASLKVGIPLGAHPPPTKISFHSKYSYISDGTYLFAKTLHPVASCGLSILSSRQQSLPLHQSPTFFTTFPTTTMHYSLLFVLASVEMLKKIILACIRNNKSGSFIIPILFFCLSLFIADMQSFQITDYVSWLPWPRPSVRGISYHPKIVPTSATSLTELDIKKNRRLYEFIMNVNWLVHKKGRRQKNGNATNVLNKYKNVLKNSRNLLNNLGIYSKLLHKHLHE